MRPARAVVLTAILAMTAAATSPRATLTHAAFEARTAAVALAEINAAEASARRALIKDPDDREAQKMHAMAVGYRAKLTSSRSDALSARKLFDALLASDPTDAEAQAAVGSWHIDAIARVGGFMAAAALGANRKAGLIALDRSVAQGGNRAFFAGLAALLRAELDPADPQARVLAETALAAPTPTALDIFIRQAAAALLVRLRADDPKGAQVLAKLWLPLGRIAH